MAKREEYLAQSLSRRQPWLAEGISRRQWERRRRKKASRKRGGQRISKGADGGGNRSEATRAAVAPTDDASQVPALKTTPQHDDENLLMRSIHAYWDSHRMTQSDPQALSKAIQAIKLPEGFEDMDRRGLSKIYRRARERLPVEYDRDIALIEKWDKSYDRRKARDLVERLVTAVGDRPLGIIDYMFDHLKQRTCDHLPKKVRWLEYVCERLEKEPYYIPQMRAALKTDAIKEQVYAALADGPKTKKELARMFRKPDGAISSVGLRLRNEGQITSIRRAGKSMWARASTAPRFIPAREAVLAELRKRPMTIPELARDTGKGTPTVKSALHRHLLANGTVIRTKLGTYALAGTASPYVSNEDAIVAALKNGPMTYQALAREVSTPSSIPQFLNFLLAKRKIIRTKRGIYALPGSAPAYVPTSDVIISALRKKPMKLASLVQYVNKSTTSARSRGTIRDVLSRLRKEGTVEKERRYGEYRLVRRARLVRRGREGAAAPAAAPRSSR
jgi:lambda repressor-like predicted transcriptional regulator